jgi:hypothetical protein
MRLKTGVDKYRSNRCPVRTQFFALPPYFTRASAEMPGGSLDSERRRNSIGVCPRTSLNTREKCWMVANPQSRAMSPTGRSERASKASALRTRTSVRNLCIELLASRLKSAANLPRESPTSSPSVLRVHSSLKRLSRIPSALERAGWIAAGEGTGFEFSTARTNSSTNASIARPARRLDAQKP